MQKSNILYLTFDCNLECEYCYQLKERKKNYKFYLSENEILEFIHEIVEREGLDTVSTVVLFGGEPLLLREKFFKVLDAFENFTHSTGKKFALSTTTNGTHLLNPKFARAFKEKIQKLQNSFSLEISYDGTGQCRRKNKQGIPVDISSVLRDFKDLVSIRYTIHAGNYESALADIIKLCERKFKKIILNFYESEIENFVDLEKYKSDLKRKLEYIFTLYKIPICHEVCEVCKGCDYWKFNGINYNSKIEVSGNANGFNHFEILNKYTKTNG